MIRTAWEDGWIPREYLEDVKNAIRVAKIDAMKWAWNDADYAAMRQLLSEVQPQDVPYGLRWRGRLVMLPTWVLNLMRGEKRG